MACSVSPSMEVTDFSIHLPTRPSRSRHVMAKKIFQKFDGSQVTESMLQEASKLFNNHYGVWGKGAEMMGAFAKEGKLAEVDSYSLLSISRKES